MRKRGELFYRALAVAALLGIGWLWWQSGRTPAVSRRPAPSPARVEKRAAARPARAPAPSPAQVLKPAPPARPGRAAKPAANAAGANGAPPVPAVSPDIYPRPALDPLEVQVALARQGISSGSLDGRIGSQTRAALRAFQAKERLPVTGEWDQATRARLALAAPPIGDCTLTTNDLARLQPLGATWLQKSQQSALDFETPLELAAERTQSHPDLLRRINPAVDWTRITAGAVIRVPEVSAPTQRVKAAFITIRLAAKTLEAFDSGTNLLAHFPCSIARDVEKRPAGELHVVAIVPNPNYTFDPDIFPESPEARELKRKLILQPGPNNPVGVAWIGLDKPGYGIHGTPLPEQIGRTESHGCFRLANWNAERLLQLAWMGLPVLIEP